MHVFTNFKRMNVIDSSKKHKNTSFSTVAKGLYLTKYTVFG